MGSVILGKLALYWCPECNLPVLGKRCSRCGSSTRAVKHTPPGDIRPAFDHDLKRIRALVDAHFGEGCGERLLPSGNLVILNRVPDRDRMEEVIVSGVVVGNYRYEIGRGYRFILKSEGALRLRRCLKKRWVIVDNEAAEFIKKGTSVLAPGVTDADPNVRAGDEVVVLTESGELIGPGTAKMSGAEMKELTHGLCVRLRNRWKEGLILPENYEQGGTWAEAIRASRNSLLNHEKEAVEFVKRTVERHPDLPVIVSLSGGKDSLATLLLVLEAGYRPDLLFLNTGLEFPETVENVKRTAERYGLRLITADAGNAFYDALRHFGPPARDYRWCCKVCKLGPTTRKIMEEFPKGVLAFIGQRAYESSQRAKKPRVWKNPWVPGQVGASPIQHWTALHIWLYIFSKGAEYNPMYEMGLARIGCWLCPASDQADYEEIRKVHPDGERWDRLLHDYAQEKGLTPEWVDYGLWKWKNPPGFVKDLMKEKGISFRAAHRRATEGTEIEMEIGKGQWPVEEEAESKPLFDEFLTFMKGESYPSCTDEFTVEGVFNRPLNMARDARLLNIMGKADYDPETGVCVVDNSVTVAAPGSISSKAPTPEEAEKRLDIAVDIIHRAEECVGCGICTGRCPTGALFLNKENRVDIHPELCQHCRLCLGKCPVVDFRGEREFEV